MKLKILLATFLTSGLALDSISAAEDEAKMPVGGKGILKAFDTNKDNKLGPSEIKSAGPKNEKTLIKRYDKNLDGTITMKELGVSEEDLVEKKERQGGGKKKKKKKGKR